MLRITRLNFSLAVVLLAASGARLHAAPYYYFVNADTADLAGQSYAMELAFTRDALAGGPTDNAIHILSFGSAGAIDAPVDQHGTVSGTLKAGLVLTDQTNGGASSYDASGVFGANFSYVIELKGSQIELANPVGSGGFAGHSLFLSQNNVAILQNPAGFGASTEIYRDGVGDSASSMDVSTNAKIAVTRIVDGIRLSNPANNTLWTGGSGAYGDAGHWTNGIPRITAISDTQIDAPAGAPVTVTLGRGGVARNLILGAGDTIDLDGYGLTLSGRLYNSGTVNASGTLAFLFDGALNDAGVTNVTGTLLSKGDLTVAAGHTLASTGFGNVLVGDVFTNNGEFQPANQFALLRAATSIVNNGVMHGTSAAMRLDAPTIVNNGSILASGVASTVDLNFSGIPLQTITGSGSWEVEAGMNVYGKVDFTTTGTFTLREGALVTSPAGSAGSKFTMPNLAGAANSRFSLTTGGTLTITDGDAAHPFDGVLAGATKLIKNGAGTQVLNGAVETFGGTEINGGVIEVHDSDNALGVGQVNINNGGTLSGEGDVGTFTVAKSGGTISPGVAGPGQLAFFSLRLLDGSALQLDLSSVGESDSLEIYSGGTHVGGTEVNIASANLALGETAWFFNFHDTIVVDANGAVIPNGVISAADFTLGDVPANMHGHLVSEFATDGFLDSGRVGFVVDALRPGADFTGDFLVNADDLDVWRAHFGATGAAATQAHGDANGDMRVDGDDFLAWQRQLQEPAESLRAVPEPGSLWLALAAALPVAARIRRHRRATPASTGA